MAFRIGPTRAVILLALVALFSGCNKGDSNLNGANAPANSARPTASPALGNSATPPTTTPATGLSASTPTAAFKAYYEAIKNKDAAAVKRLFSKATLKEVENEATQKKKTYDEVFNEGLERAAKEVPPTIPETRNEKIDDQHATLEVKNDKKETWSTVKFVKEDDEWKISFADEDND